ncbi:Fusaric acid resistance protein-like [Agreia bicolorata]|uniref:Fusaric acid resistance protein-like n=1 Tax=Agreia bicolorata TaxID=110935 RepID=A0A1T4YIV2_9MICO|nr:FUSC family protein [Agreia bicolorata]SKB01613.1 Fusaric acid resistance protein-like [Agreia bicolorata]
MSSPTLPHPRQLVAFGPHGGAHTVAVRAGISMAVPLIVLWLTGHLDLSLYAAFGAFTALYGRNHSHLPRLRMQSLAAVMMVSAVVIGTTVGVFDAREWIVVPVVAVVAALVTIFSNAADLHPPGALFATFAVAACASVPSTPASIGLALAVASASAAFSLAVGVIGFVHPSARRRPRSTFSISFRDAIAQPGIASTIARLMIGILLAGAVPTVVGIGHPYWAMVAVVAALSGPDATARLVRAGHRILGTIIGLGLAALLFAADLPTPATIAVVVALQMTAELFIGRNYGLTMVFVTPLALCMIELAHSADGGALITDRLIETVFGAVVGIVLTLLWRPRSSAIVHP